MNCMKTRGIDVASSLNIAIYLCFVNLEPILYTCLPMCIQNNFLLQYNRIKFAPFLVAREDQAKEVIAAAMKEWSSKTCLQFKERNYEQAYVTFRIGFGFVSQQFF